MKSEDVLPDQVNGVVLNGVTVRKGSVGAFLANARVLDNAAAPPVERERARLDLVDLVPALAMLGLFEIFSIRNPDLASLVEHAMAGRSP